MELQNNAVSSSSVLKSWSSAETLTFSDLDEDPEVANFVNENTCAVCRQKPSLSTCGKLASQWLERNICCLVVNNIVYLKCRSCYKVFHLSCIAQPLSVEELRDYIEEDYCCDRCC